MTTSLIDEDVIQLDNTVIMTNYVSVLISIFISKIELKN